MFRSGIQTVLPVSGDLDIAGALLHYLGNGVESSHTERAYRRHIHSAFEQMGCRTIDDLTAPKLSEWRTSLLNDGRGLSSHKQALAAVRAFLTWASAFGGLNLNKAALELALRLPKGSVKNPYSVLNRDEVGRLIGSATKPRNKAALLLLLGSGVRVAEASAIDIEDLKQADEGWLLHIRKGKGSQERLVPIANEVILAIEDYLIDSSRLHGSKGPLLLAEDRGNIGRSSARLSCQGLRLIVRKSAASARIVKRCSPHTLRHTYAIEALRKWRDVAAVSKLLGHKDVRTTMLYLDHFELGELRAHIPQWTA